MNRTIAEIGQSILFRMNFIFSRMSICICCPPFVRTRPDASWRNRIDSAIGALERKSPEQQPPSPILRRLPAPESNETAPSR